MIELSITGKDEETRLTKDYLIYEIITLCEDDPILQKCVKEILEEFKGKPDSLILKTKMDLSQYVSTQRK